MDHDSSEDMKLVTWNIHGRTEPLDHVSKFLELHAPDALFLQGRGVDSFRTDFFSQWGYEVHFGEGDDENTLALVSRIPGVSTLSVHMASLSPGQTHVAGFKLAGIQFYNVTCPEAREPTGAEFQAKLKFIEEFAGWLSSVHSPEERIVLLGDWSIAPLPDDVEFPEAMGHCVGYHPQEHKVWAKLLSAGFFDGVKPHVLSRTFSRWKGGSEDGGPRGMRSDHILVTAPLEEATSSAKIYTEMRSGSGPSHVPVEISVEPDAFMEESSLWGGF